MYWATVDVVAQLGRQFVISNAHTADDEHIENISFLMTKWLNWDPEARLFHDSHSPGNMAASSHGLFFKNMLIYSSFVVVNHQHGLPWKQIE